MQGHLNSLALMAVAFEVQPGGFIDSCPCLPAIIGLRVAGILLHVALLLRGHVGGHVLAVIEIIIVRVKNKGSSEAK